MSAALARTLRVARLDLSQNARRLMFWVWVALLALLAWGFSAGGVQIQAGDSQVGGQKAFITSQFAVSQQMAILGLMVYGFFAAVMAGMALVHDHELRVVELLSTTSLRPREYVWGKFAAALITCGIAGALHLGLMLLFNHAVPGGADSAELRGPLVLANYVRPMLLFLVPVVVFLAGVSFGLGEWSRSAILVFVLPVALLLFCGFFLWDWSPDWLSPAWNRVLMLLDPTGFRWLKETWLDVDRGVEFYNTASVPLDAPFIISRLAFVAIGLAGVFGAQRHLARSLRGARAPKGAEQALAAAQSAPVATVEPPIDRPLGTLGMTSRRPGLLAGAWRAARVELRELASSPGLYIFVPLILLQTIGISLTAVGAFSTPLLSTPGTLAVSAMAPLTVMVCLLLLFYTTESILRERTVRLDAIAYATPVRTASLLIGKVIASAVVGAVILLAALVADVTVLLVQGKVAIDLKPFALVWGLLLVPTFVAWCAFVAAVLALTRNRYATYAIGLGVLAFSAYRFLRGNMNWVGNWPLWRAVRWSDLSLLEFDRLALILNRAWILSLAAVFTALTGLWFSRRERDPSGIAARLRPLALLKTGLKLAPVVIPAAVLGIGLWVKVEGGSDGGRVKQKQREYWKQNLATWKDYPLPSLVAVAMDLDLDPVRSAFQAKGSYRLVNRTDRPLRALPVTTGAHWTDVTWTWDGAPATPENRSGLYVFTPPGSIAPGQEVTLGFSYRGTFPAGISENGGGAGEFILPSGVVLTSFGTSFAPVLGYVEAVGVEPDKNAYEAKRFEKDFYEGKTEAGFGSGQLMTTRIAITAPADLTVNSVGQKVSQSDAADGRRTVVWESDEPVHFFNVVAGRWAEKRGEGTAVYYHPGHAYNVDQLSAALDAARKHYSEWFHPYPWGELKLSEFPGLAGYAQGFPTNITFSESIGFLTNAADQADAAFMVAAHESAHQWWGNLLLPGKGPGGNVLSEGLSHYATTLLMEEVRGPNARMEFSKRIEKSYNRQRNADEERPLYETDGSLPTDSTVTYDRGGWVFWMLQQHLGRAKMLEGLQAFIKQYRVTDDFPVLQDFVATMRPFAADPAAYDAFVAQWFAGEVLPEFRVTDAKREKTADGRWQVVATVENHGTGTVTVGVGAERGKRFDKEGKPLDDYQRQLTEVTLAAGAKAEVRIDCGFEPDRLTVDPDVLVLQVFRDKAKFDF